MESLKHYSPSETSCSLEKALCERQVGAVELTRC